MHSSYQAGRQPFQYHFSCNGPCRHLAKMTVNQKLALWYLRVSRVLGLFPLSRSSDGALTFSLCSLPTVVSVTMAILFTAVAADRIYFELKHHELSYRLTVLPSVIMTLLSDHLIRISSMRYSNDLVRLLELTDNCNSQCRGQDRMGYLYIAPTMYLTASISRLIGRGFVNPELRWSMTNLKTESGWDKLLAPGIALCEFFHNGSFSLALYFLIIFGRRVVATLDLLCTQVLENCIPSVVCMSRGDIQAGGKAEALGSAVHARSFGHKLVQMLVQLKTAFDIYSNIAGAFTFAVVIDIGLWVFKMTCRVLFIRESTEFLLSSAMGICHGLIALLMLLMVAEVGHEIAHQVRHHNWYLETFLLI